MRGVKENEIRRHRQYLHTINKMPALTEEEEVELFRRWHEDQDYGARDKIIQAHLRLVPSMSRRTADQFGYRPQAGEPQEAWDGYWNLQREVLLGGNEGLLKALRRFDPGRGVRFAAYARWWIKKGCQQEAAKWLAKRGKTLRSLSLDAGSVDEHEMLASSLQNLLTSPDQNNLIGLAGMLENRLAVLIIRANGAFFEPAV